MTNSIDNSVVGKHLGKQSDYTGKYNKSLLVREKRSNNRDLLDIGHTLPFRGFDTWNGYEVSCLLDNGIPVNFIVKVVYPCDSEYIVESKSMKLYWNSFNMTHMGATYDDVLKNLKETTERDLSELLKCDVRVGVHQYRYIFNNKSELYPINNIRKYTNYDFLLDDKCHENILMWYDENPNLLYTDYKDNSKYDRTLYFHTSLLKSNCRVTSQPDWGDVFIYMKGKNLPVEESLLYYIISFRNECHFHEEICESIYVNLMNKFSLTELSVTCLYTRRGGWDINPQRCSHEYLYNINMFDESLEWVKTCRQ